MRTSIWGSCAALVVATLASGCASITGSEMQSVLVSTKDKSGSVVEKAECVLQSEKGNWKVVTPGSVIVLRSAEDMQVQCTKEGQVPGLAKLVSRAHGGMFGNIIFGGGIGALIDHSKGTGYEYPNLAVIIMGDTVLIDRKDEVEANLRAGSNTPGQTIPASATSCPPNQGKC